MAKQFLLTRFTALTNYLNGSHIKILFGPGINDVFFPKINGEVKFENALSYALQEVGYKRIFFMAPHRSIYQIDGDQATHFHYELCGPSDLHDVTETLEMNYLQDGPLHKKQLLKLERKQPRIMGDMHMLRTVEKILTEERDEKSAVVFTQAESIIDWIDDRRLFSGIIGDFAKLPSSNANICIFTFSSNDLTNIQERVYVPEIRNILIKQAINNDSAFRIGYPEADEIQNMVKYYCSHNRIPYKQEDVSRLIIWMVNDQQLLRFWCDKVKLTSQLTIADCIRDGWFKAQSGEFEPVHDRISKLVGVDSIKERLFDLEAVIKLRHQSSNENIKNKLPNMNFIFQGNPGTGKTTMARIVGELLHELNVLKKGHLIEVRSGDMVADYVGGTPVRVNALVDQAIDGVLFIDEAYSLGGDDRGGYGKEAIDTLMSRMDQDQDRLVVIAVGYPQQMMEFISSNPGLARRFPEENRFHFNDFTNDQLFVILENMLSERNLFYPPDFSNNLRNLIDNNFARRSENFANAGDISQLVDGIERQYANRVLDQGDTYNKDLIWDDIPNKYVSNNIVINDELDKSLAELNKLIGLKNVKITLNRLISRIHLDNIRANSNENIYLQKPLDNFIFAGNPGTGKTTVARIIGNFYTHLGILKSGHTIEVTRSDLVAGYVGQTSIKTKAVFASAVDGVLFIDEAYSLSRYHENDYGTEAIDTLVKLMEDYKGRIVVIAAGYPGLMKDFINKNPGLKSRFSSTIVFDDFTEDELIAIFFDLAKKENYLLQQDLIDQLSGYFSFIKSSNQEQFGNARTVISIFNEIKNNMAVRVLQTLRMDPEIANHDPKFIHTFISSDIPQDISIDIDTFIPPSSSINAYQTKPRLYSIN